MPTNSSQRKLLDKLFAQPASGNIEWREIEALLLGSGCNRIEGSGSSVTFEKEGLRAYFHRPHSDKAALRYRVLAAREFLELIGVKP